MSETEDLPTWAQRAVQDPATTTAGTGQPPEPGGKRKGLLFTVLGLAAIIAAGLILLFITRADDSEVAADDPSEESDSATNPTIGASAESDGEETGAGSEAAGDDATATTAPATTTTEATSTTETTVDADTAAGAVDNSDGSIRHAIFKGGQVFLRGRVPSEEISQEIETKAAAVVGPDNVFNEYEIDPSVPASIPAPIFVEDVVLFAFNSIRVENAFLPILDLGTLLMVQNPNVTITVVTRTDAVGSEEVNLEVSRQRAQAVINYWLRKGIDPSRVIADPRGEEGTSEDDDEQTAALNRRAEFIITGLLD